MLCSFGIHRWGTWEYTEKEQGMNVYVNGVAGKRYMIMVSRGRRVCERCGKEELSQEKVTMDDT